MRDLFTQDGALLQKQGIGSGDNRKRISVPEWERLSILLNLLTPKLPAPKEDDLARGILEPSIWTATASKKRLS
jgi:hypothetical protein